MCSIGIVRIIWHGASGAYGEQFARVALVIEASLIGVVMFAGHRRSDATIDPACLNGWILPVLSLKPGYHCRCARFSYLSLVAKKCFY